MQLRSVNIECLHQVSNVSASSLACLVSKEIFDTALFMGVRSSSQCCVKYLVPKPGYNIYTVRHGSLPARYILEKVTVSLPASFQCAKWYTDWKVLRWCINAMDQFEIT